MRTVKKTHFMMLIIPLHQLDPLRATSLLGLDRLPRPAEQHHPHMGMGIRIIIINHTHATLLLFRIPAYLLPLHTCQRRHRITYIDRRSQLMRFLARIPGSQLRCALHLRQALVSRMATPVHIIGTRGAVLNVLSYLPPCNNRHLSPHPTHTHAHPTLHDLSSRIPFKSDILL